MYTVVVRSCAHSGCCVRIRFARFSHPPHSIVETFSGPSIETKTISCVPSIPGVVCVCVCVSRACTVKVDWLSRARKKWIFRFLNWIQHFTLICIRNQSFYRQQHVNAFSFFGKRQRRKITILLFIDIIIDGESNWWLPIENGVPKRKSVILTFLPLASFISYFECFCCILLQKKILFGFVSTSSTFMCCCPWHHKYVTQLQF